ncbi:MAG: M23 family metallopeptidase [Prolixibacteraceae bacterium]|nr:M23 family metallopeptidase [Prolixibacteraceae bacterium]
MSSSLVFSVIIIFLIVNNYETPKAKSVMHENQRMASQIKLMKKDMEDIDRALEDIQQRDDNIYRVIFESEPIPSSVRKAGFGGVNKYAHLENMSNSDLIISTARKLDVLSKQVYVQSQSYDELLGLALSKEKMLASIPAIQPISNKDLKRTSSGWGYRIHPIYKVNKFHYGMDFTASEGTEIYVTGDGTVQDVVDTRSGFGKHVVVSHGYGYATLYAHLYKFNVRPGQKVKRGEVIGYTGNTGTSSAPHLHYEVHKNGSPVNPQHYYHLDDLTPEEYEKMIAISSNMGQTFD